MARLRLIPKKMKAIHLRDEMRNIANRAVIDRVNYRVHNMVGDWLFHRIDHRINSICEPIIFNYKT